MLIGIRARVGSGKDTTADMIAGKHLVRAHGKITNVRDLLRDEGYPPEFEPMIPSAVKLAFADPFKVFLMDVYGFSPSDLWGPSELRMRQIKPGGDRDERTLTVREGCLGFGEKGRELHPDTWVDYLFRFQDELEKRRVTDARTNVLSFKLERAAVFVVSDVRRVNEAQAIIDRGGEIWEVRNPRRKEGPEFVENHPTETDLEGEVIESLRSELIENDDDLSTLRRRVAIALENARERDRERHAAAIQRARAEELEEKKRPLPPRAR